MSVNSIADGVATFKLPVFNKSTVQLKQPVKDSAGALVQGDSAQASDVAVLAEKADNNQARGMSHIAESYNSKGQVITKYMDSSNNIIYQTPSEMVVKTQELMTNTQAAKNIKG